MTTKSIGKGKENVTVTLAIEQAALLKLLAGYENISRNELMRQFVQKGIRYRINAKFSRFSARRQRELGRVLAKLMQAERRGEA